MHHNNKSVYTSLLAGLLLAFPLFAAASNDYPTTARDEHAINKKPA